VTDRRADATADDRLAVTTAAIDAAATEDWAAVPAAGAVVAFRGVVRDHAEGRTGVDSITYEAYEEPARLRLVEVAEEARRRWPGICRLALIHKVGLVALSEASVLVVVSAAHRGEAFEAARWCIDTIRRRCRSGSRSTRRPVRGGPIGHACAPGAIDRTGGWSSRRGWMRAPRAVPAAGSRAQRRRVAAVMLRNRRPSGTHVSIDDSSAASTPYGRPPSPRRGARPAEAGKAGSVARDLAIDLGTANTLVYARGQGIILNEPTVIALNSRTHDVLAMGHEAWQMIGRTPAHRAVRPLRGGAITDFEITQRMIRLLFQRAGVSRLYRARVLICVPSAITHVEQRAVLEAARRAGAAATYLLEQPMAAAIGAGLPIHEPLGNMVVDVGGGTTEVAVISLGGTVALEAVRVGSFDIDSAIQAYVRREYGIAIGERTAEEIKLAIGSAFPTEDEFKAEVRGRDLINGLPKVIILSPEEVRDAIEEQVRAICDAVISALARTHPSWPGPHPPGIHLVAAAACSGAWPPHLSGAALDVHLVDAPLEAVVLGAVAASSSSTSCARCSCVAAPLTPPSAAPCRPAAGVQVSGPRGLADLPVGIAAAAASAPRRRVRRTGQRQDGAPADAGRSRRREDSLEALRISPRPEGGDRALPHEGFGVASRHGREGRHHSRRDGVPGHLAQGPGRGLRDRRIAIGEEREQPRARDGGADRGGELRGPTSHGGRGVRRSPAPRPQRGGRSRAPDDRPERGGGGPGVGIDGDHRHQAGDRPPRWSGVRGRWPPRPRPSPRDRRTRARAGGLA